MAIFVFDSKAYGTEYGPIVKQAYQALSVLLVLHLVCNIAGCGKDIGNVFGIGGKLFNHSFITSTALVILSILAYNLILKEIIEIV